MRSLKQCRVLVVDDADENIDLLFECLKDRVQVELARSGEEALASAAARSPDLVLLDIVMPGMDGFEVFKRLKTSSKTWDVPVLFLTALDNIEDRMRGFELGAVDFITKPFFAQEVIARVEAQLKLRLQRLQIEDAHAELRRKVASHSGRMMMLTKELQRPLQGLLADLNQFLCESGVYLNGEQLAKLYGAFENAESLTQNLRDALEIQSLDSGLEAVRLEPLAAPDFLAAVLERFGPELRTRVRVNELAEQRFNCDPLLASRVFERLFRHCFDTLDHEEMVDVVVEQRADRLVFELSGARFPGSQERVASQLSRIQPRIFSWSLVPRPMSLALFYCRTALEAQGAHLDLRPCLESRSLGQKWQFKCAFLLEPALGLERRGGPGRASSHLARKTPSRSSRRPSGRSTVLSC